MKIFALCSLQMAVQGGFIDPLLHRLDADLERQMSAARREVSSVTAILMADLQDPLLMHALICGLAVICFILEQITYRMKSFELFVN